MKYFLNNSKNITRDSYIWNMIGSFLLAFQSVILLIIITHSIGIIEAGIFTLAYANANLFFMVGKYGIKPFQASDQKEEYLFGDYLMCRIFTSLLMLFSSVAYIYYIAKINNYSFEKSVIFISLCILKISDVFEDLFFGRLQQKGRMDIAAKSVALRSFLVTFSFSVAIIYTKNLLLSSLFAAILSFVLLVVITHWTLPPFISRPLTFQLRCVGGLLKNCFPLFLGSFLAIYIVNAPKYSIDKLLDDELQAHYGFLSMPIMVIGLLNGIIFNPIVAEMSLNWLQHQLKPFVYRIIKQVIVLILITMLCIGVAYFLGLPVLSYIYNTDLSNYRSILLILLFGGGLYGFSGLLSILITIIRYQKYITIGYLSISILAFLISDFIIRQYLLLGAAILYTVLVGMLCLYFSIILIVGIARKKG